MVWDIRLSPFDRKQINMAIEYLHANYTSPISADMLALEFDMDIRRLQKGFKEKTGMTVHEYLIHYRILRAIIDLETTNLILKVIASKHGFATQSHFIELFKKRRGITPNQHRNLLRR
ncbi:MAG TPA: AraC family transcriptional regulator [Puia sp.]|jgi:AraC-like DNA-binding protein